MLKLLLLLSILQEILSLQTPKFSEDSKLTLVTTSCGRMDLLKRTYASYFKQNHYPLREIRIIDDCSTPEEEIMAALPVKAKEKEFVTIIVNKKHLGQFASIDRIYQEIKTKFVLHLEDDFLALPNNNII
jgi:glycosyltransferase involved in cell wall biosynthesis